MAMGATIPMSTQALSRGLEEPRASTRLDSVARSGPSLIAGEEEAVREAHLDAARQRGHALAVAVINCVAGSWPPWCSPWRAPSSALALPASEGELPWSFPAHSPTRSSRCCLGFAMMAVQGVTREACRRAFTRLFCSPLPLGLGMYSRRRRSTGPRRGCGVARGRWRVVERASPARVARTARTRPHGADRRRSGPRCSTSTGWDPRAGPHSKTHPRQDDIANGRRKQAARRGATRRRGARPATPAGSTAGTPSARSSEELFGGYLLLFWLILTRGLPGWPAATLVAAVLRPWSAGNARATLASGPRRRDARRRRARRWRR